jgi:hypothetical protein
VVGVPGHIVAYTNPDNDTVLRLPDPEWDIIEELEERVAGLEERLGKLEGAPADEEPPSPRPSRRRASSAHKRPTKEPK